MTWIRKSDDDKPLSIEQARGKIAKAMSDLRAGKNPGTIVFRLKRTKKPGELYLLKLTPQQRKSLIHCTRLRRGIKNKIEQVGEGTQVIGVTRKELDHLNDEIGQASVYAPSPHKKRLIAVLRKVSDLLVEDHAGLFGEEIAKTRKTAPKKGDLLYQFKITLLDTKPPIWRRIQVPDCTLADLHEMIQAAMGWENCHMHQFIIDGEPYGTPLPDDFDFGDEIHNEKKEDLNKLLPKSARRTRWFYEYDFGDGWRHEVLFEGYPTAEPKAKYPLCLEGERACPPEDCGGPWGYPEFLAAIADPKHDQHEDMIEWIGEFDPETFDPKQATKEMRKVK